MITSASAPGKVMLSGEYAVLDGAPAVVMAVDRRARVVLRDSGGGIGTVTAPGYTSVVGRFEVANDGIRWFEGDGLYDIVDCVWRVAGVAGSFDVELDTSAFMASASDKKLGIGSSAALTVALCAAVRPSVARETLMALAEEAHRALQGGVGSGADIASSLYGGLIEYRMQDTSVQVLTWPPGLFFRVIWTGETASTKEKIDRLARRARKASRTRLAAAATGLAEAWRSGSADRIIGEFSTYIESLLRFSIDHELGIFDAGHEELWRTAAGAGLVYKPCGAGGGDVGILLGTDAGKLNAFVDDLPERLQLVDCGLSLQGVLAEEAEQGSE